jgi:iron complex transport system permease protein
MREDEHGTLWISGLALLLAGSAILSLGFGTAPIDLRAALGALTNAIAGRPGTPAEVASVVLQIRLPRTLLAILIGALLAIAGAVMQAFFRNPMAEPYLVGVSSGAALGAVLAILLGWEFHAGFFSTVPLCAFLGALGVTALVYSLSRRRSGLHTGGLLLSGIAIGSAISAIVALLMITSERSIQQVIFWLLGSLSAARWEHLAVIAPYAVAGIAITIFLARDLDLLLWGDVTSAALGVHVERSRTLLLGAATLMAAAAVAIAGVIGFVGLMVPHLARAWVGTGHRRLVPAAGLLGGLLLLWADVLARTIGAPTELPLGAITAIVGAPFLVYLCMRGGRMRWPF